MLEQRTPKLNANDDQMEIAAWLVKPGEFVKKGQALVEISTSKAVAKIDAEEEGYVRLHRSERDLIRVGDVLVEFYPSRDELPSGESDPPTAKSSPPSIRYDATRLSVAALQYLKDSGRSASEFSGAGLVTRRHLEKPVEKIEAPTKVLSPTPASGPAPAPARIPERTRRETIPMAKQAEISALTPVQAGLVVSSLTVELEAWKILAQLEGPRSYGTSILPLILYQTGRLLAKHPKLNAFFHADQIHYYRDINIGVALDIKQGLKVPVLRQANEQLPKDIHQWLLDAGMRYMRGELSLEDFSDGTFTVTDLSSQGIRTFQPLVNQFQSAILGVGGDFTLEKKPLSLTLAFDHRVLTGMEIADFLSDLKSSLLAHGESD